MRFFSAITKRKILMRISNGSQSANKLPTKSRYHEFGRMFSKDIVDLLWHFANCKNEMYQSQLSDLAGN